MFAAVHFHKNAFQVINILIWRSLLYYNNFTEMNSTCVKYLSWYKNTEDLQSSHKFVQ